MADNFGFIQTQKQSGEVAPGAFGDFRGLQSVAKGMDDLARMGEVLKARQKKRDLTSFQLRNRQFVEEQKEQGVGAEELMNNYTQFFQKEVEAFPDEKEELMLNTYFATVDSASFRSYMSEKEAEAQQQKVDEVSVQFTNDWTTGGHVVNNEELKAYHDMVDSLEDYPDEEVAKMEILALSTADSLDAFDSMVPNTRVAARDPNRIKAIRDGLERDIARQEKALKGKVLDGLTDWVSRTETVGLGVGLDDIINVNDIVAAGGDEKDIQNAIYGNANILLLQTQAWKPPAYFEGLTDPQTLRNTLLSRGMPEENIDILFRNKTQLGNFINLAKQYNEMPPAKRLQTHPEVAPHIQEGDWYLALTAMKDLMLPPDPNDETADPSQHWYMDERDVYQNIIPPDMISSFRSQTDPLQFTSDHIKEQHRLIRRQIGPEFKAAFDQALTTDLLKNRKDEPPEVSAYNAMIAVSGDSAIDWLTRGVREGENAKTRFLADKGESAEKYDARIQTRVMGDEKIQAFLNYFESVGNTVDYDTFSDMMGKAVYASVAAGNSFSKAVEELKEAVGESHRVIQTEGMRRPFLMKKEHYIKPGGWAESTIQGIAELIGSGDAAEEMFANRMMEQIVENPREGRSYEAFDEGAPMVNIYYLKAPITFFANARNQLSGLPRAAYRKLAGQNPNTIYDSTKYEWQGAIGDNDQDMFARAASGWLFPKADLDIRNAIGKDGKPGFTVWSKGEDTSEYNVPLLDKESGAPAVLLFDEMFVPDVR